MGGLNYCVDGWAVLSDTLSNGMNGDGTVEDGKNASCADPTTARNVQAYLRVHAPVLLRTYTQQVGGHALLMELGENVICKPVHPREKFIYESIPEEIRDFTPEYHGKSPSGLFLERGLWRSNGKWM